MQLSMIRVTTPGHRQLDLSDDLWDLLTLPTDALFLLQKPQRMLIMLACITSTASPPLTAPLLCSSCTNALENPLCQLQKPNLMMP